ncbi:unnamed protein product [Heligmosomoides polygyrus]|uniref:Small subunit processome component 20 homolog n=1 Tax=Heligmosomoides polygyrus TaxID=6339 RepID=A0A183GPE5_HELPZ|nr:unnamed protein product [Heligmosomoides polygyrus]
MRLQRRRPVRPLHTAPVQVSGALVDVGIRQLFNKFFHHAVSEMYSHDVWPGLTARTRKRKNQYVDFESELVINFVKAMYEKANKEVRTSFYFDVFNMITVALYVIN